MVFWKDLFIPVVILVIALGIIYVVVNAFFRFIHFDVTILKIIAFFAIWYYVGPIIYGWLVDHVIVYEQEAIKILYMPMQYIYSALRKLV